MDRSSDTAAGGVVSLARDADTSLAEQLADRYAERIRQRLLAPGARLPSVRECARRHEVSPSTVVAAYDRLLALGLVEARRQRGFYVRAPRAAAASARTDGAGDPGGAAAANARHGAAAASGAGPGGALAPHAERTLAAPVDATALIRGMFHHGGYPAGPGLGTLPPAWLDGAMLQAALRRVATRGGDPTLGLSYGEPAGDRRLRDALALRLNDLSISVPAERIVTTLGATQALDIVSRVLLQPGDAVLVDEPGWAVEFARLTQMGMRLLPVPRGPQGPDLEVMRSLIVAHRPRLYVTVSVLHNPTGASLGLAAAHQLLKLAEAHDLWIVEDDTYAWFAPEHTPRLSALDGLQRTFYIGGFSKILAPGWRVGYVAAPAAMLERIVDVKLLTALTTPALLEQAVASCLEQGLLRRHAERVLAQLDRARARSVALAEAAGCRFAAPPQGLFGWVDVGADTERLAQALLDEGWLIAPGSLFHAAPRPTTLMRINFASSQEAGFWRSLQRLGQRFA